jgi:hypothetical protein
MLACIQSQPPLFTAPRSVQIPPEAVAFGIRKNGLIMSVNIVMQRMTSDTSLQQLFSGREFLLSLKTVLEVLLNVHLQELLAGKS